MATAVLTVDDPPREFPWLVTAVMTALRNDDAIVYMPALRALDPPSGALPLDSTDVAGLRRVAAESIALARLDGVTAQVVWHGE